MQDFGHIFQNQVLMVSLFACVFAQTAKLAIELIRFGKVNFRALVTTGGMPSSHSAFVSALATSVGQTIGWESPEFAISVVFAFIVMYDATGVRQAAGQQARILNQIVDELFQEHPQFNEDRLKELLGHTPFQVIVGLTLGIVISWIAELAYP
ncbi:MAG: divergent PAP2 family protein [Lyngbya sp.]|nr:divergent PAP2 family protein [Lyngbya sp.]